jgi:DNA-binding MarR family transcriptional regulator
VDTDGEGPTRQEVAGRLADIADGPYEVPRAIDQLLARGWIGAGTGGHLHLTNAGRAAKGRTKQLVTDLRAQIHDGITDEEYVATLKVLRRMIHNIERSAALR